MKVLLYFPDMTGVTHQFQKLIEACIPEENLEVCHTIDRLSQRFRQPYFDLGVAVLVATNHEELMDIFSIRDLLKDLQIILVIPDQKQETVALAHQLRPRLLSYMNGDLSMVPKVLTRMFGS